MTSASLIFRLVDASDAEPLAALRVEAMRPSLESVGRFDPHRARRRFLDAFSPEHTHEILSDGIRVGFFVVRPQEHGLVLDHLYVRPTHQGCGIGAAVLRAVFAEADARGVAVRVGALKESESNRFYGRHGFVMVSQTEFDNHYVRRPGRRIQVPVPPAD
ncbi:GNAT family N-acetyltransferase [Ramlibacter sp. MMS24-I3-19]|uniref:GNAT family N-acetyltransferase n=1 Tax=Ramlibacter sp. MMS24-I3-19 TaxID=3416606 RepID=UPI003D0049FF